MLKSIKEINYNGKIAFLCTCKDLQLLSDLYKDGCKIDVYMKNPSSTSIFESVEHDIKLVTPTIIEKTVCEVFSPIDYNAVVISSEEFNDVKEKCISLATPLFTI
ncbi:MAG: hypothetical protein RSA01_05475 [Clostridium sp.]|uniref:hypothetical protein n=1 Tax=Clostridium sp. TaxID=1506 RepID=UPI002FCAE1B5